MPQGLFFACRILYAKPKRQFVILQETEIPRRHDVEVASKGFQTAADAELAVRALRGTIPDDFDMYLDFFWEDGKTVWCWNDCRSYGASQTFDSEEEALEGWRNETLVFTVLLD